jgi:iron-sulfur cluster assembly accessory protein
MKGSINVTKNALSNITRLQDEYDSKEAGLRFGLTGGGCSGYKYILEFEMLPNDDDIIFEFDKVKVFVSKLHIGLLKNATIDWNEDLMTAGFDIDNPQAKRACGCGESIAFDK